MNERAIGLKTKLKGRDVNILMQLFQGLFDTNFWRMEEILEKQPHANAEQMLQIL